MHDDYLKLKDNIPETEGNILNEFIKRHNVNMSIWYIDSFKIKDGKWTIVSKWRDQDLTWKDGVMNGHAERKNEFITGENKTLSIEVTFKRKPIETDLLNSFKELMDKMPTVFEGEFTVRSLTIRKKVEKGVAAEISTFDAHLGKLAWEQETGYRNYDLNIAIEDYRYVNDNNLERVSLHKPEKIVYIVGQDLYHMDNLAGHTTGGDHTLDVDGRITKVHNKAFSVTRDNIINCSKVAPVEVIWIPGNHDFLASYMLAFALKVYFKNYKRVTVDVNENPRKARLWGSLLVGWTHSITGKHTVWSNELAQAFPELWGKSVFREWHHGDQHKKLDTKVTPIFTSGGVVCRQLTALSPVDKWHTDNIFTDAVPGGEAFLWSQDQGIFANFISWVGQYENYRN